MSLMRRTPCWKTLHANIQRLKGCAHASTSPDRNGTDQVRFRSTLQHSLGLIVETAFDGVVLLKDCKQSWHRRI